MHVNKSVQRIYNLHQDGLGQQITSHYYIFSAMALTYLTRP